jgi:type II secretory pathway pseudopilin PulG
MTLDRIMFLSMAVVALVLLGMVAIVVLLRHLGSIRSAKKNSSAKKSVEPKK